MIDWLTRKLRGAHGEALAAAHMQRNGYAVAAYNWRPRNQGDRRAHGLELDLICTQNQELVFVEVKTRSVSPASLFTPEDAFTAKKRMRLIKAVGYFLHEQEAWSLACRIDLICIVLHPNGSHTLEHYPNVIECPTHGGTPMGGGHTYWQPW